MKKKVAKSLFCLRMHCNTQDLDFSRKKIETSQRCVWMWYKQIQCARSRGDAPQMPHNYLKKKKKKLKKKEIERDKRAMSIWKYKRNRLFLTPNEWWYKRVPETSRQKHDSVTLQHSMFMEYGWAKCQNKPRWNTQRRK